MSANRLKLPRARWILLGFAIVWGVPLLWFQVSGIRERRAVDSLVSDRAPATRFHTLLGLPTESGPTSNFEGSRANKVFTSESFPADSKFSFWAKEGIPYYWILIIEQDQNLPP